MIGSLNETPSDLATLFCASVLLSAIIFVSKTPLILFCGDTTWHLLAGMLIRTEGFVWSDPWAISQTDASFTWYNLSWLWDIFVSILFEISGSLYFPWLFNILINSLVFGGILAFAKRNGSSIPSIILVSTFALVSFSFGLAIRPQQVTSLFSLIFLFALSERNLRKSRVYVLPILTALWSNLHGGFVLAPFLAGAFFLQELFSTQRREVLNYGFLFILCITATILNPYGIYVYEGIYRTMGGSLHEYISEWDTLVDINFRWHALYFLLYLPSLFLLWRQKKLRLAEALISFTWFLMSISSARFLPLAVIFSFSITTRGIDAFFLSLGGKLEEYWEIKGYEYQKDFALAGRKVAIWGLGIILLSPIGALVPELRFSFGDARSPMQAVQHIDRNFGAARVMNDYFFGGCLLFHTHPRVKHFIDGRAETAFSPKRIEDFLSFAECKPNWKTILEQNSIDVALVMKESPADRCLSEDSRWALQFEGSVARVYSPTS